MLDRRARLRQRGGSAAHALEEIELPAHFLDRQREAAAPDPRSTALGARRASSVCSGPAQRIEKPAFQTRLTSPLALRSVAARSTTETGTSAATASIAVAQRVSPR